MDTVASVITSLTIVCAAVYSGADQKKHQSSAPLVFVRGIHRSPVNCPHKGPVTRKMFPFDDVIMIRVRFRKCTWFRFTLLSCDYNFVIMRLQSVNLMRFPIFFKITLLVWRQSYDCPCAGEVILKDMVNYFSFLTLQQQSTNLMNSFWAGQLLRPILRPFQSFDSSKFRSPDLRLGHAKSQVYLSTLTFHGVGCQ